MPKKEINEDFKVKEVKDWPEKKVSQMVQEMVKAAETLFKGTADADLMASRILAIYKKML